ncbi:MAG: transposase [Candidatus Aminicenantes bacterium]|nr:transposase [Candidatus Aminicenantes bacterium]
MSRKALESRDVSVETAAGPEALAFYGNKLVILDQEVVILDKCFSLKLELRHGNLHFHPMDYLEFIARTTSHIPDKSQVMIRYSGLYANAHP